MKMTEEKSENKAVVTVEDVQSLIKKKDEIEEEIKAYYDVLEDVSVHQKKEKAVEIARAVCEMFINHCL